MTINKISFQSITAKEARELKTAFKKQFGISALAKRNTKGSMKGTLYFTVRALNTSDTYKADTAVYSRFLADLGYIAGCMAHDMLEAPYDANKAPSLWNWTTATVYKLAAK